MMKNELFCTFCPLKPINKILHNIIFSLHFRIRGHRTRDLMASIISWLWMFLLFLWKRNSKVLDSFGIDGKNGLFLTLLISNSLVWNFALQVKAAASFERGSTTIEEELSHFSVNKIPNVADEFNGPFPSWTNVKRDFGAIGDGIQDDTIATKPH